MFHYNINLSELSNTIITSYKLLTQIKNKYPKRKVIPTIYMHDNDFCYWTKLGELRIVRNEKEIHNLQRRLR